MIIIKYQCHGAAGVEAPEALDTVINVNDLGMTVFGGGFCEDRIFISLLGLRTNLDTLQAYDASILVSGDRKFTGHHSHLFMRLPSCLRRLILNSRCPMVWVAHERQGS